jgi:hypothetical protein
MGRNRPNNRYCGGSALYPVVIKAAKLLGKDAELVRELKAALPKVPPFPRTYAATKTSLLSQSEDGNGQDIIAESYLPDAANHNAENIGLEPVWPYDLIGDTSPLFALAKRTYAHRPFNRVCRLELRSYSSRTARIGE